MSFSSSHPRGSNHGGMRQYNDRVILQLLRQHGCLSKAELARQSGLTAQTLSLITTRLEDEGLIAREAAVRGRIGQPSIPFALNPEGAFALGLHIGRREAQLVLTDFVGGVRGKNTVQYDYPQPDHLFAWLSKQTQNLRALIPAKVPIKGIGVAAPFALSGWREWLGEKQAKPWTHVDIAQRVEQATGFEVVAVRDTLAACAAELLNGHGRTLKNFLYLYIDTFIGGSWVFNSRLYYGVHGNGGAVASLPLHLARTTPPTQLWRVASLWTLEQSLQQANLDPRAVYDERILTPPFATVTRQWVADTANALAYVISSATAFVDVGAVVIDGACAAQLVDEVHKATEQALASYDWEGLWQPTVNAGHHNMNAAALGGALLPLYDLFSLNPDVFIKETLETKDAAEK